MVKLSHKLTFHQFTLPQYTSKSPSKMKIQTMQINMQKYAKNFKTKLAQNFVILFN